MAIAWWLEYFDRDGNLLKRRRTYNASDALVEWIMEDTRLVTHRHLLPPGTVRVDLIHGTQRVRSTDLAFIPPHAA